MCLFLAVSINHLGIIGHLTSSWRNTTLNTWTWIARPPGLKSALLLTHLGKQGYGDIFLGFWEINSVISPSLLSPPTVATMDWIIERLQATENLPEEEARQEQRQLALQTNFSMLPPELFYMVLDWTFGLVDLPANPPLLCKTDFHTLHGIEDLGDEVRDRIAVWMQTQKVRNAFKNHIGAHDNFEAALESSQTSENPPRVITSSPNNPGPSDIWHGIGCTKCFDFLVRHDIIKLAGYDRCHESWLQVALSKNAHETLQYLLPRLTLEECFQHREAGISLTTDQLKRSLVSDIIRTRWQWGLEHLVDRLLAANEDLTQYISDRNYLELCRFVTADFAEKLRVAGINIATAASRTRSGAVVQHAWHAAIENSNAPDFLSWLLDYSDQGPDAIDGQGSNTLIVATRQMRPEVVQFLCQRLDPALLLTGGGGSTQMAILGYSPSAFELAATSFIPRSVEVFRIILEALPADHFHSLDNGRTALEAICVALRKEREETRLPGARVPERLAKNIACHKYAMVVDRLPVAWSSSQQRQEIVDLVQRTNNEQLLDFMTPHSHPTLPEIE